MRWLILLEGEVVTGVPFSTDEPWPWENRREGLDVGSSKTRVKAGLPSLRSRLGVRAGLWVIRSALRTKSDRTSLRSLACFTKSFKLLVSKLNFVLPAPCPEFDDAFGYRDHMAVMTDLPTSASSSDFSGDPGRSGIGGCSA